MMKKLYVTPEIEITKFRLTDVILASEHIKDDDIHDLTGQDPNGSLEEFP